MASFEGFIWLLGLTVFFFVIVLVTTILNPSLDNSDLIPDTTFTAYCDDPRFAVANDGTEYEVPKTSSRCVQTRAITEEQCNLIVGCTWINQSWWFSDNSCSGTITKQNLTNTTILPLTLYNICSFESLQNEETCYLYGCTWVERPINDLNKIGKIGAIVKTLGALFTFTYDFGVDGIMGLIINFFIFYLPLLALIGCIYFLIWGV